ncbi:MAG: zinc-ribbon domain-containing protein [Anaerolineae bacterium]|nr:zinc-ribbon domain-containing protein [Anaerolineae bacterium]
MFCPNCGTQNADGSKFCSSCGKALQTTMPSTPVIRPSPLPPTYYTPPRPSNPLPMVATVGSVVGMVGGVLIVIGWFLPWSSIRLGSGPQILGLLLTGGLLGGLADDGIGALFALLALGMAVVVVLIPIWGFLCGRIGMHLFENRAESSKYVIQEELQRLRGRATFVLVLMAIIFVLTSLIPFLGGAVLGRGYYLMVVGAVIIFLGTLYGRSQLGSAEAVSQYQPVIHSQPISTTDSESITEQERRILELLSQGLPNQEIAARLGKRPIETSLMVTDLQEKMGVLNERELVKKARVQGLIPPG